MEERDLIKELDELLKPTDPPEGAAVKNTTETPSPILLESILPRLPPEGQAWLNGLNPFCGVSFHTKAATISFISSSLSVSLGALRPARRR
jgi:hypothetical protein